MFSNLPIEDRFENFAKNRSYSNRILVKRLKEVPLLHYRLNEYMFPARKGLLMKQFTKR